LYHISVPDMGRKRRYIEKYVSENYVPKKIRKDLYNKLLAWCGEYSINICLAKALEALGVPISTREPQASAQAVPTSTRKKIVKWVRADKIKDPEKFFGAIEKDEGKKVIWSQPNERWYCFAFLDDVEKVVEELNREGWDLNKIQEHPLAGDLHACSLIMKEKGVWKIVV